MIELATLAAPLLAALSGFRERFLTRVHEVNSMTEREVLGAARSVEQVVAAARRHVETTRTALAKVNDDAGITRAIAHQNETIRHYTSEMSTRIDEQCRTADDALATLKDLTRGAESVTVLAYEARLLAMNARIQAGRSGEGSTFTVIATEMERLSRQIDRANGLISELAGALSTSLPALGQRAAELRGAADAMTSELAVAIGSVEGATSELRGQVRDTLAAGDAAMSEVMSSSAEALSHLQFQDSVAQGLLRIDGWIRELQVEAAQHLGADPGDLPAPAHVEIGGEKAVDIVGAGEVLLF